MSTYLPQHWSNLIENLGPRLYRYFCSSFSRDIADDLVQETLIRLYQKTIDHSFDEQKGTLTCYAFGIAHYVRLEKMKHNIKNFKMSEESDICLDIDTPLRHTQPDELQMQRWKKAVSKELNQRKKFGWSQLAAAATIGFILGATFFGNNFFNETYTQKNNEKNFEPDATIVYIRAKSN